jgi:hypothetical protein
MIGSMNELGYRGTGSEEPPVARWERELADAEAERIAAAVVADHADGVDVDEAREAFLRSLDRLTLVQRALVCEHLQGLAGLS